jgi:Tfp pilus assembly protein PilX
MEEKMAGNNRVKHRSFELAEMDLAQAAQHIARITKDNKALLLPFKDNKALLLPFYAHGLYSDHSCSNAHPATNGLYQIGINSNSKNNHPWSCESVFSPNNSLQANIPDDARKSGQDVPSSPQPRFMIGLEGEVELDGMGSSTFSRKYFRFYLTAQAKGGVTTIKTTLQAEALRAY